MEVKRYTMKEINLISPIKFWCVQFSEHCLMIINGLVKHNKEIEKIVNDAQKWYDFWIDIDYNDLQEIRKNIESFKQFHIILLELMNNMWTGYLLPAIIHHMLDELIHFEHYIEGTKIDDRDNILDFWLKHHNEFIEVFLKILDPSLKNITNDLENFKMYFKDSLENDKILNFFNDTLEFKEYIDGNIPENLKDVIYPLLINHDYNELLFSIREMRI